MTTLESLDLQLALSAPCTDLGNAQRFVTRNRGSLIWRPYEGWFHRSGEQWRSDTVRRQVLMVAHSCVRAIGSEARALVAAGRDYTVASARGAGAQLMRSVELEAWALRSSDITRLEAMISAARPYLFDQIRTA